MQQVFAYYPMADTVLSELFLAQCGWETCESGHSYGPAVRDHFLIHYVARGAGTFHREGESRRLGAGDGFLIYPGETTTYVADIDDPWEYYWVGFSGVGAQPLLERAGISDRRPVFHLTRPADEVADCIRAIHTHASFSTGGELRALGQLLHFLSLVMDEAPASRKQRTDTVQSDYVATAVRIIQERHGDRLTVEEVARGVGIDRTHLFRAFKSCLGVGPQQYMVSFRVQRACQLLLETDMPVRAISDYVGFSSPTHLGVAFRRLHGLSPRDYRTEFGR